MRLKDICTIFIDGDWIESKDQSDEGIRLIQTGNIGEGIYLEKETRAKYISEDTFEKLKCTEVYPGDILVSRLPEPVGRACIIPEKKERMITAVDCTICRPDKSIVSKEYLCYFMRSNAYYARLLGSVTGTTRKRISRKNLGNVELDIPSKKVQKEVVKQLDCLVSAIDSRTKELQLLDDLIKARFVEMFGNPEANEKEWKMNTFGDICTVRQGLQIPISKRLTQYEDDCYEYITVQYLHGGKEREYIKSPKTSVICTQNDILMTRTGNTGMVVTGVDGVFHNNFFLIDFDRNKYDKDFLVQYLKLDIIQADILRRAGTSTIPDLNHSDFYKIKIFEPPIELQKQFTELITQVDKSKLQKFSAA